MIAKKNSRYDLERKRFVLFLVGLLTAGSFTLAAFSYSTEVNFAHEKDLVPEDFIVFSSIPEELPKEKDPIVEQQQQEQVEQQASLELEPDPSLENSREMENTGELPDISELPPVGPPGGFGGEIVEIVDTAIVKFPIKEAAYAGGYNAMQEFINKTLRYPDIDIQMGNQGTAYISFVVEKDGSVSNVKVVRGVTQTIDREAERVVESFPKWIPGEGAQGKVRTRVRLPLVFTIK